MKVIIAGKIVDGQLAKSRRAIEEVNEPQDFILLMTKQCALLIGPRKLD